MIILPGELKILSYELVVEVIIHSRSIEVGSVNVYFKAEKSNKQC